MALETLQGELEVLVARAREGRWCTGGCHFGVCVWADRVGVVLLLGGIVGEAVALGVVACTATTPCLYESCQPLMHTPHARMYRKHGHPRCVCIPRHPAGATTLHQQHCIISCPHRHTHQHHQRRQCQCYRRGCVASTQGGPGGAAAHGGGAGASGHPCSGWCVVDLIGVGIGLA